MSYPALEPEIYVKIALSVILDGNTTFLQKFIGEAYGLKLGSRSRCTLSDPVLGPKIYVRFVFFVTLVDSTSCILHA